MKKLFGNLKMNWLTVILFAVIAGVYTGAVMLISIFDETSFQDIGISYECWVIFAVIIVVNCRKNWEAMLKCFVFFLISQPIVFAVEVLFGNEMTWQTAFCNYYLHIWFPATLLTIPGGFIAYYCKKQNWLGAIILALGNTMQAGLGIYYLAQAVKDFPHHILSSALSFASIVVMGLYIQKEKKYRLISILVPFAFVAVIAVLLKLTGRTFI